MVDVGANPIDGDPPYKILLQKRLCRVTGFEPQAEALAVLNTRKSDLETYLPNVIADGKSAMLHICRAPGMTSLYKPAAQMLNHFRSFPEWGTVIKEIPVSTSRLDDVIAEDALDFLKIDVQGGELTAIEKWPALSCVCRHNTNRGFLFTAIRETADICGNRSSVAHAWIHSAHIRRN